MTTSDKPGIIASIQEIRDVLEARGNYTGLAGGSMHDEREQAVAKLVGNMLAMDAASLNRLLIAEVDERGLLTELHGAVGALHDELERTGALDGPANATQYLTYRLRRADAGLSGAGDSETVAAHWQQKIDALTPLTPPGEETQPKARQGKAEPIQSSLEYSAAGLEANRRHGCVTRSGVVYDEELAGPGGMSFVLLPEPHTTPEMLKAAVEQLRADRDVVGTIKLGRVNFEEKQPERPRGG